MVESSRGANQSSACEPALRVVLALGDGMSSGGVRGWAARPSTSPTPTALDIFVEQHQRSGAAAAATTAHSRHRVGTLGMYDTEGRDEREEQRAAQAAFIAALIDMRKEVCSSTSRSSSIF